MYTDSLVAFLDILGLSDSVRETETNEPKAQAIANMLAEIQEIIKIINGGAKRGWKAKFAAHGFSDSILISCPISEKAFVFMAHIIATFQFATMRRQFFLRGGISAGGHYDKEGVVFGPALVKAYEMEKVSIWPRVLIDTVVLKKLSPETIGAALQSYVSQDQNGLCYLHYLHLLMVQKLFPFLEKERPTTKEIYNAVSAEPLRNHKRYLLTAVERLKANAQFDLLPKYHAIADYHNCYVKLLYQDLPTQENYKNVDPTTVTGQIINGIKTLASSRKEMEGENIDFLLDQYTRVLYQDRQQFREYEIDLGTVFRPLYPHLD